MAHGVLGVVGRSGGRDSGDFIESMVSTVGAGGRGKPTLAWEVLCGYRHWW